MRLVRFPFPHPPRDWATYNSFGEKMMPELRILDLSRAIKAAKLAATKKG